MHPVSVGLSWESVQESEHFRLLLSPTSWWFSDTVHFLYFLCPSNKVQREGVVYKCILFAFAAVFTAVQRETCGKHHSDQAVKNPFWWKNRGVLYRWWDWPESVFLGTYRNIRTRTCRYTVTALDLGSHPVWAHAFLIRPSRKQQTGRLGLRFFFTKHWLEPEWIHDSYFW